MVTHRWLSERKVVHQCIEEHVLMLLACFSFMFVMSLTFQYVVHHHISPFPFPPHLLQVLALCASTTSTDVTEMMDTWEQGAWKGFEPATEHRHRNDTVARVDDLAVQQASCFLLIGYHWNLQNNLDGYIYIYIYIYILLIAAFDFR